MSVLAARFVENFERTFGYPPGENVVHMVSPEESNDAARRLTDLRVRPELQRFYSIIRDISLPDVENGFFIHPAEQVVDGIRGVQPTRVAGAIKDEIVVFGSDGGGALFALNGAGDKIYRLTGGALVGAEYDVEESGVEIITYEFWGFLDYLRDKLLEAMP
ncbi:hypothetical protein [Nonomuraea sp. CA-141351]|uniref:hypothetical protein n=1 Tax=Nonomuraea sp. CA-141351 TaxID=3239996 RepID=UPI003D90A46A